MKKNLLVTSIVAAVTLSIGVATYAMQGGEGQMQGGGFGFGGGMPMMMGRGNHLAFGTGSGMSGEHMKFERGFGEKGGGMGPHQGKGPQGPMMSEALRAAVKANDYNAFVTAWNEQQSKVTAPTQEQFAQQVKMFTAHQAIENAILANDYEAFKTAITNMPKPIDKDGKEMTDTKDRPLPTQEQFAQQVKMFSAHQAIENAIVSNNYEAFKTAMSNMPKPTDNNGKEITNLKTLPLPTAEEFAKMVEGKKKQQTIESALKANDYTAFLTAWTANKPTVPTSEEFKTIVAKGNEMKDDRKILDVKELKKDKKDMKKMVKRTGKSRRQIWKESKKK